MANCISGDAIYKHTYGPCCSSNHLITLNRICESVCLSKISLCLAPSGSQSVVLGRLPTSYLDLSGNEFFIYWWRYHIRHSVEVSVREQAAPFRWIWSEFRCFHTRSYFDRTPQFSRVHALILSLGYCLCGGLQNLPVFMWVSPRFVVSCTLDVDWHLKVTAQYEWTGFSVMNRFSTQGVFPGQNQCCQDWPQIRHHSNQNNLFIKTNYGLGWKAKPGARGTVKGAKDCPEQGSFTL